MLKIVVLQKFYDLSDEAEAYEMTNRFGFMRFFWESFHVEHLFRAIAQMGSDRLHSNGIFRAVSNVGLSSLFYDLRRCSQFGVVLGRPMCPLVD